MVHGEVGGRKAKARGGSRREIGDERICAVEQPMEDVHTHVRLQVQCDRFLAPVAPDEVRGEATGSVDDVVVVAGEVTAVGVLHLDHARAQVGKHPGAHRGGHRLLHRHHRDAGQRRLRWLSFR